MTENPPPMPRCVAAAAMPPTIKPAATNPSVTGALAPRTIGATMPATIGVKPATFTKKPRRFAWAL